jgi:predicted metal-dependent hydrolase
MYPEDNETVKIEPQDVEKDLSNIMTEHYHNNKNYRRRMPVFWMFLFMIIVILVLFMFMKRS